MEFIYIIAGLILLFFGGDYLVKGASGLAIKLKVTPMLVGMTVVAVGTSAPELVVSLQAALIGKPDIAIGNVVGSNIANVGFILGLTVLIFPLAVKRDSLRFDWLAMITASLLFSLAAIDGGYSKGEGLVFIILLVAFIVFSFRRITRKKPELDTDVPVAPSHYNLWVLVAFVIFGSVALVLGAKWFLSGATDIAVYFGVSDRVIALSLVAFGTSVPELAASIVAAFKKEQDISLGNIIGSNLFNIFLIIGVTAIIHPVSVSAEMLNNDYIWMMATSFAIMPLALHRKRISRLGGILLIVSYLVYIYLLIESST